MAATASAHGVSGAVASGHVKNDAMTTTAAIPTGAISAPGSGRPAMRSTSRPQPTHRMNATTGNRTQLCRNISATTGCVAAVSNGGSP